jgi:hypothetical protein
MASRCYRWRGGGVVERVLAEVQRRADAGGELDWLCHYVDGSVVGARQHAAGAVMLPPVRTGTGSRTRRMRRWEQAAAG